MKKESPKELRMLAPDAFREKLSRRAFLQGGTALAGANQVKLTAKATVTDNGAAALAAVNALATTVASLKTLITTLTNLVLKIQKKVKA